MRVAFVDALRQLETSGEAAVTMWEQDTMRVVLLAPGEVDTQETPTQDEVYIVMSGCAEVLYTDRVMDIDSGDCLFVPAGEWHRFINPTPDFTLWMITLPARIS